MAAVGWAANPYLALIDPAARYQGPSPEMMYPQQQQQPPQQTGAAATSTGFDTLSASPYQPEPTDAGLGGKGIEGTSEYGPIDAATRSNMGLANLGMKALGTVGTYAGVPALSSLSLATAPLSFVSLASRLASMFGAPPGYDPFSSVTNTDIQGVRDVQGAFAADEASAAREAQNREANAQYGLGFDIGGSRSGGPAGFDASPAPGLGPETGWGAAGPDSGNSPGGAGMGSDSANGGPGSEGGGPGVRARGGVGFAKLGAKRETYGERGPEKAIFIPQRGSQYDMTKPGIQGNERSVKKALSSNLKKLRR